MVLLYASKHIYAKYFSFEERSFFFFFFFFFFFEVQLDHCDVLTVTAFRYAFRKQRSFGSRPMDRNKIKLSKLNEQNI